ncbi:MAG: type secretion system tip protein VgrG [Massilia sp.]|nr:type secretion system tip protein VgrG [Massilia sp.]
MGDQLLSALGLFGTGLSQNARLITLATAQDSGLPESLMAERFVGREAVNELFRFEVDALSVSTDLELDQFLGEEITLKLLLADGSRRAWHGICTRAAWVGADGGVARYRLRLEPALHLLRERRDSYIFQDKTVQEIVDELLADYPQVRCAFELVEQLGPRAVCTQYRESDFDFLQRILASEGLNWRFEHDQASDDDSHAQAKHKLVIFDSKAVAPEMPGDTALRFHGVRATETSDAIDQFGAVRQVSPNSVTNSSWHPEHLFAHAGEQVSSIDAGELPVLEIHDGSGERRHADADAARRHSELMLQASELDNKQFTGAGAVRQMAAGHLFQMTQHELYPAGEDRFTVLWVDHEARNNFDPALAKGGTRALEGGTYRNSFGCVREMVALVPVFARRPITTGSQTALVVGLPESVATTGRDHQVKIQFAWQRGSAANPGGIAHNTDERGNAPGKETSGAWVRVAEAVAGPNWGSQFTPRICTEVLVEYIEGDIDRPVVGGQKYTPADELPYSAGIDTSANHAGVLSGIHSNNFDGRGYNQWQIDDTQAQLRMRLASSTAATQLNLGYLIQQPPGSAQRGNYRGSGFELRTDAWAMIRGGDGVLISTTARPSSGSGVSSTQMDAAEALGGLKAAQELSKVLSGAAGQQKALASKDSIAAFSQFIKLIDPKQDGKHAGAFKTKAGSKDPDPDKPVEKFGAPVVLMDSASTINWATPASTVIYAGQQLNWTTQADVHFAVGHTVASVAAGAAVFFTHSGGIQAFAGNGAFSLQAHADQLEILADQSITIISVNDAIEIKAKEKIIIQSGQSAITLEGGNITFACPGNFTVKGRKHTFDHGSQEPARISRLPDTRQQNYDEQIRAVNEQTGEPICGLPYQLSTALGMSTTDSTT